MAVRTHVAGERTLLAPSGLDLGVGARAVEDVVLGVGHLGIVLAYGRRAQRRLDGIGGAVGAHAVRRHDRERLPAADEQRAAAFLPGVRIHRPARVHVLQARPRLAARRLHACDGVACDKWALELVRERRDARRGRDPVEGVNVRLLEEGKELVI